MMVDNNSLVKLIDRILFPKSVYSLKGPIFNTNRLVLSPGSTGCEKKCLQFHVLDRNAGIAQTFAECPSDIFRDFFCGPNEEVSLHSVDAVIDMSFQFAVFASELGLS
jgi:hypothetical protein